VKPLLACLLCCAVTAGWAQSQHPELPFDHLTIPGTINSSQVNDLIQDHHGLIWVAGNGLYRYDGYKFNLYKNISDSTTIAGQEIHCLFSDARTNQLLIGTHSYGIVKRDYVSGKFTVIPSRGGIPIISHIARTSDGTIWGSSFSNGVFFIENDTLKKFSDPQEKFNSNSCILSLGSKLLVGGNRNVYTIENKELVDSIYINFPDFNFSPVTRVTALMADRSGKLWIGTEQFGVFVYDTLARTFVKHFSPDTSPFHNRINKILESKNGRIWILVKGEGLVVYSPSTGNYIHVVKNPLSERSLSGNNCTSIIQDQTDIIWVGSTGDLNKYDPTKIKFRHIYNNPFALVSLHDNMVRGIYEDADRKLWVGTDGGVVHIFDKKRLTVEKIEIQLDGKKRIAPLYFMDLDKNILLIGTSEGMLQYDRRTKRMGYYPPLKNHTQGRQVRQMVMHNGVLFYTSFGNLQAYHFKTRQLTEYNHRSDAATVKNSTTLYVDNSNRLWVGVRDGISLYDPATDQFTHFGIEKNASRPLGSYFMILSLYEFMGKLWIGSYNDGLWTLDLSSLDNPVITNVSRKHDIQNMTVYSTIPDSEGNLWMSTNAGITKYNPATDQYLDFTVTEGLQQDEFNRLAFSRCSNGDIVYGGINGLNIFNPKNITLEEEDYTPRFLDVTIFDDEFNTEIPVRIDTARTVSLAYDQNNINISFFVPRYRNPKRYETFYTLEGYTQEWTKAETNSLHYANLKPGEYTFRLKTISVSGKEKFAALKFNVLHPFWQSWWFIALTVISTCLIVVTIIQGSLYKSRRDKERLEKLLSIRTQEIEKSREELANLNQKKDLIFSILSHDLRSPLTTLKGFLSILIDDHELTQADIKKHASNIRNSVTSSLDLIDNTLFWSLSQTGNISYTPTTFSLNDMLQKIGNLYHLIVEKKRINFSIELNENIMLFADENMTYVSLRNLVSNALKFTPQGNAVRIKAFTNNATGIVVVEDEGIGMSQSYLEKLFTEEQLPLTKGTNDEKGTGIGLILCRKFIQLNKGRLSVKSVEGKGSQFTIELPLAQDGK
jgi:signal transduction histidine kinase/ligand-binding sensor domain-containing protein